MIKLGGSLSSIADASFGVLQGSAQSPLVSTLYATALSSMIAGHAILHSIYADDNQLYVSFASGDPAAVLNGLYALYELFHALSLPSNPLRLNDGITLLVPTVWTNAGARAVHSSIPSFWNNLPLSACSATSSGLRVCLLLQLLKPTVPPGAYLCYVPPGPYLCYLAACCPAWMKCGHVTTLHGYETAFCQLAQKQLFLSLRKGAC